MRAMSSPPSSVPPPNPLLTVAPARCWQVAMLGGRAAVRVRIVPLSAMGTMALGPFRRAADPFAAGVGPVLAGTTIRRRVMGHCPGLALVPGLGVFRRGTARGSDPGACGNGPRGGRNAGRTRIAGAAGGLRSGAVGRCTGMAAAAACAFRMELSLPGLRACAASAQAAGCVAARSSRWLAGFGGRRTARIGLGGTRARPGQHRLLATAVGK